MLPNFFLKNKLALVAVLLFVLAGGSFLFEKDFFAKKIGLNSQNTKTFSNQNTKSDSDNDGLPDWQEAIYKSDPQNPDSDGDGYYDGEEIASGHDPIKNGSNDILTKTSRVAENLTEQVVKKFTQKVTEEKEKLTKTGQNGGMASLKPFDVNKIAEDTAASLSKTLDYLPKISLWDLNISTDKSAKAVKNYAVSAIKIISRNFAIVNSLPAEETIKKAIETDDFSQINIWISSYEKIFSDLKTLEVPSLILASHQEALTTISGLTQSLNNIKQSKNDPINQLSEVKKYMILTGEWSDLISRTNSELQTKYKINFSDEDIKNIATK